MANQTKVVHSEVDQRLLEESETYRALKERQYVPFFQPIITLRTSELAGFEMLGRWQHPTKGIISPDRFIGVAEREGWISELSRQLLEKAFAAAAAIPDHLTLAINISPIQLRDVGVAEEIRSIADAAGFSLSRLIVEITESAMIDNLETARVTVSELKAMGCKLALDDFGTGYSSLHHLQALPFDELKVDRSFVSSMTTKRQSRKIVSAVVGLGQSLGLTNVAEGIETQEQAEMMLWLGCELGQGYFYSRPIPEADLANLILAQRPKLTTHSSSPWKRATAGSVSPSDRLAQMQAVYDGAPVGLAFIDHNLQYVNLNERLAEMHGASVEDHLGRKLSDMIPKTLPYIEHDIRRALSGEAIFDKEVKFADSGRTHLASFQPALDEAGEVIGISIAVTDITDRKRTEEALKQSEHHYRNIVELNPQVLWVMDPTGRNLDVSPRWDKKTGLMQAQSPTHDWLNLVHPGDIQFVVRSIAESRRNGESIKVEYRVEDGDGGWTWKRSVGSPRFDANGNIVCWYGSILDIDAPGKTWDRRSAFQIDKIDKIKETSEISTQGLSLCLGEKEKRLQALEELEILDTPAEAEFDDLVFLAAELCCAPISALTFLDAERQWFKASIGLTVSETPLSDSFCTYAVEQQRLLVVQDASKDARFKDNPLVTGEPHVRFYAGMPLFTEDRVGIGTLCVFDTVPRSLSPTEAKTLTILAQQIQVRLELRHERKQLQRALEQNQQETGNLLAEQKAVRCA